MTKYYSPKVLFRSETGKLFHGAEEMKTWMKDLFFSFEKIQHVPEYYMQHSYKTAEGQKVTKVHAQFRRLLWLKGNVGDEADVEAPVAWICEIGKADEADGDGYLGLQFKEVSLYWDKTKTVELLKRGLPSDE
ncbi:hypothetical protein CKM354_000791200 [Cercospora kikuchii]|uniref:Uncharacterized protein n=1 Tax=Cercospora kikuchii TaxID=84275 RepID=A0A9P3CLW6_9PEZI|nr:uncharacterized protein CKM354_000791200 [Cercospora kikuchii]GIZ44721.1 hypothetical protein CKM354_000791200 [Cercospora kikuchii]